MYLKYVFKIKLHSDIEIGEDERSVRKEIICTWSY